MKSKEKDKPSLMPEDEQEGSLYLRAGSQAASYTRKCVKGKRTSRVPSHLQNSRSSNNCFSGNTDNKLTARAAETCLSLEKEQITPSTATKLSVAKGDEKVVESEDAKSHVTVKSQMELNSVKEGSLYVSGGSQTVSYRRKRLKRQRTSGEASCFPTSRSSQDSYSENADDKETANATETCLSFEREEITPSATIELSLANGGEEVVEIQVAKPLVTDESQMELNNEDEQLGRKHTISSHKNQNNPVTQSNLPSNAESPLSASIGSPADSVDCKNVERADKFCVEIEGTSLYGQFSSGSSDREKPTPVLDSDASKEGRDVTAKSLVSSKAAGVDMSTETGAHIPANGALTSYMEEETDSDSEDSVSSQDVKVCDICGDAGQEGLLAFCSRCSDGAEHTYCMQIKLHKIPEGDWLCEGCKLKEDTENQQQKSETEDKIINEPCSTEHSQCTGQTLNSTRGSHAETNGTIPVVAENMRELLSTAMSTLRKLKKLNINSVSNDKTSEASFRPLTTTMLRKNASVADEKSANESDMIRPSQLAISCDKSENFIDQWHHISSDSSKIQPSAESRGTLSKSSLFSNSEVPKVKPLVEDFLQMQKAIKEPNLNNNHKGLMQAATELASSRNISDRTSGINTETSSKIQSHNSHWRQATSTKQIKEINNADKKSSSLLDIAFAGHVSSVSNSSKDIESIFYDEKVNKSYESSHSGTKIGLTGANSLAPNEVNQAPLLSLMNGGNKSQKCRDAGELARTVTESEVPSQSVDVSAFKTDKNSEAPAKHLPSAVSNFPLKMPTEVVVAHAPVVLGSHCADPFKIAANNHVQPKGNGLKIPAINCNRSSVFNNVDKLSIKPNLQISVEQASFLSQPVQASIIPELEYIWQGTFQVLRSGKHPRTHDGFQAHLSTVVSTKAIEVANMFPCKLQLEEVPRQGSWPSQFKENSPKEDNIALFFFAKDITSYKCHYQKLLENMMKNDLALRGNINAVELLIFPSNVLPEGYRQWNKTMFFWGVFMEKKSSYMRDLIDINKNPFSLELSVPSVVDDLSSHNTVQAASSHDITCDSTLKSRLLKEFENNSSCSMELQDISSLRTGKDRISDINPTKTFLQDAKKEIAAQKLHLLPTSCATVIISNAPDFSIPSTKPKINIDIEQLPVEVEDLNCLCKLGDSDTKGVACSCDVSAGFEDSDSKITEQKINNENVLMESLVSADDLSRKLVETENVRWQSRLNLKCTHSSLEETIPSIGKTSEEHAGTRIPNDVKDGKKMKIDNGRHSSDSTIEDNTSNKECFEIHPPLSNLTGDSYCARNFPECSEISGFLLPNKDVLDSNIPELELVVGGNKRLDKQANMFLPAPKMAKECNHDKLLAAPSSDLDEESGSLTLSLTFPDSGTMKMDKPVAQVMQLFPAKPWY